MMTDFSTAEGVAKAEAVAEYVRVSLEKQGLNFSGSKRKEVLVLVFAGGNYQITANLFCGENFLCIQAALPIVVPESSFSTLLFKMNELNRMAPVGGFELHTASGTAIYKIGIPIMPKPSPAELEDLVMQAVSAVDVESKEIAKIALEPSSKG